MNKVQKDTKKQLDETYICASCGVKIPEKSVHPKGDRNLCKPCWEYEEMVDLLYSQKY